MAKIVVLYGTTEGQTAKIASGLPLAGCTVIESTSSIWSKSIRRSSRCLRRRISRRVDPRRFASAVRLSLAPGPHGGADPRSTAAFTACLAVRSLNENERAEARAFSALYEEKTVWKPDVPEFFAGALMYSEYSWLVRMVMKSIARREGGSTETSHDSEYTDWTTTWR
jgi:menaquinone-dependent protoporphyrinogen oxidase